MSVPAWWHYAACRNRDTTLFYPTLARLSDMRRAKAICATCAARDACLQYALANHEDDGIWGGRSEHERRRLRLKVET